MEYSLGVPGFVIWPTHILIGAFIAFIGYNILYKIPINTNFGLLLILLGSTAIFYHLHLWYLNYTGFDPMRDVVVME